MTVSRDVMMGDYVVIPRGTPAHGQIAHRTSKGAFGKSAKMEFELVDGCCQTNVAGASVCC